MPRAGAAVAATRISRQTHQSIRCAQGGDRPRRARRRRPLTSGSKRTLCGDLSGTPPLATVRTTHSVQVCGWHHHNHIDSLISSFDMDCYTSLVKVPLELRGIVFCKFSWYFSCRFTKLHLKDHLNEPVEDMVVSLSTGDVTRQVWMMMGTHKRPTITDSWSDFAKATGIREYQICVFAFKIEKEKISLIVHEL